MTFGTQGWGADAEESQKIFDCYVNAGGNGRKHIYQAIDASLRRPKTDYIDLYWMHTWDGLTPVDEVMDTLDSLVRAGKVHYLGMSDVPAWYFTRAQTLAELTHSAKLTALQLEYSLIERNIEREHIPAALELGIGICPWAPLGSGFLTGKYRKAKNHQGPRRRPTGQTDRWILPS